jgi:hypothetical protein
MARLCAISHSLLFLFALALALLLATHGVEPPQALTMHVAHKEGAWKIAVLGDSDSQSYQKKLTSTHEPIGGVHASLAFQWTEMLDQLAGADFDLGRWGIWGTSHLVARVRNWFGAPPRTPKKEDFEYNFAIGGAGCRDLNEGLNAQLPHLLALMNADPAAWQRSIVAIRMGVNDFGHKAEFDLLANDPKDATIAQKMEHCVQRIKEVVQTVHQNHPNTRFVIFGIFDNRHWAPYLSYWQSAQEGENIDQGLRHFDETLRHWTQSDQRLAFFDERALFTKYFGGRDPQGIPDYRDWSPEGGVSIHVAQGDEPHNMDLGNGHNGTAYNALCAQHLVSIVRERFDPGVAPVSDHDLGAYLAQLLGARLDSR